MKKIMCGIVLSGLLVGCGDGDKKNGTAPLPDLNSGTGQPSAPPAPPSIPPPPKM